VLLLFGGDEIHQAFIESGGFMAKTSSGSQYKGGINTMLNSHTCTFTIFSLFGLLMVMEG